ncbi:DUF3953 domain-containing protein [Lentibacillus salicampi]|uniref:DUF3953 domain-containing protein n=1 Tax=Lentibacillus TaxID=175304 RepID=UPI003CC90FB2
MVSGSIYSLITGEYGIQPYIQLLSGLMVFSLGLKMFQENRQNRKAKATFSLFASGFVLFVSIFVSIYVLLS